MILCFQENLIGAIIQSVPTHIRESERERERSSGNHDDNLALCSDNDSREETQTVADVILNRAPFFKVSMCLRWRTYSNVYMYMYVSLSVPATM